MPGISAKVLSSSLKDLEEQGLVVRRVEPSRPVRIYYSLSEQGTDLRALVEEMRGWGERWRAPRQ